MTEDKTKESKATWESGKQEHTWQWAWRRATHVYKEDPRKAGGADEDQEGVLEGTTDKQKKWDRKKRREEEEEEREG